MRDFSEKELKEILNGLDEGKQYCGITKNGYGEGVIYKTLHGYIGWRHYGESANDFTLNGLKFVLNVIFYDCETICEAKYDDGYLNYVPVDKKYKGFSYKRKSFCENGIC